jgi:glyoxylase-like metal-dependent hydrolase (beta-lactamase superfamily II)
MIKVFRDRLFYTNTYLIVEDGFSIVIDPGFSYKGIIRYLEDNKLKLKGILATHGHIDHIIGANPILERFNAEFYMNPYDIGIMNKIGTIYPKFRDVEYPKPTRRLCEGKIEIERFKLDIIETPGHTPGSVSIIYDDIVFTGDTLFKESIGRTDLGGDIDKLVESIHKKLFKLPKDMLVYPGHGELTTIGYEIVNNPYVGLNGIYPFSEYRD